MGVERACIIGAGSSGIVAAKILHERGIPFDCYEKGSGIGGLWRYQNDNAMSAAYRSLHINTSREQMQYSDFPMPAGYPDFPHHSLILKYFESYVDHFGFRERVTFQTSVLQVDPQEDGTFRVETEQNGRRNSAEYAAVLVANGHHWKPRWPAFPGRFYGQVMHSHDYRTPEDLAGKRVLVVGMGNSACDIVCEVSRVAQSTFMSVRRGAHVIPKYIFGMPLDQVISGWVWRYVPRPLFQKIFDISVRLARGRVTQYGLPKPQHKILQSHPTISSDLLNLVGQGKIQIRPNVERLGGNGVHFVDGRQADVDTIIYATGYEVSIPFLDSEILDTCDNQVRLFKHVVHTRTPNLYFIGLIQPWGALMPLAEEQSNWVADLLEGKCGLPSAGAMERDIDRCQQKMNQRYTQSVRHTIQVDFYPYLDELRRQRRRRGNRVSPATTSELATALLRRAA